MNAHPHAKLMRLYAEDAAVTNTPWEWWETRTSKISRWYALDSNPTWTKTSEYRRITATININGFEVPEPLRKEPKTGFYYVPSLLKYGPLQLRWTGDEHDIDYLNKGLCHTTREAAEIHGKAMISFTEKKND